MTIDLTADEKTALSVLAFLFFRMGMDERAGRIYEALAELSDAGSPDRRFAKTGEAAVKLELGKAEAALDALREAIPDGTPSSRDAILYLLKSRALAMAHRHSESLEALEQFDYLTGKKTPPH